jgi:hypothetical protein
MAIGIRHADHVAPSIRKKLALTSLTSGGRSVGRVRLRTEAMEFLLLLLFIFFYTVLTCGRKDWDEGESRELVSLINIQNREC